MPEPLYTALTVLALGIWAGAFRMAFEIVVVGRRARPPGPDVLSGLAQRNRADFVRNGRPARAEEISRQVQKIEPAMPQDDPIDLDFEFYSRSS